MKWTSEDVKKYVEAKEFIDTLIIPLKAFHLSNEASLEKDVFDREVLGIYANEIEKELSGRVFLTPAYTYLKSTELEKEAERLNNWIADMKTQPFTSIFLLTFDNAWKKVEKNLHGELLWLPSMKPGNIKSDEAMTLIRGQVEQISELIRSYW